MEESNVLSQSEINDLLSSMSNNDIGSSAGESESQKSHSPKGYKIYNFKRPDKFSKDHLRALQDIHKEFSRQLALALTAYLRMRIEIDVVSVDQLTYDEFIRSMPSPITVGIVEPYPLPGQILIGISHETVSSVVDRMFGGVGASENKPRELTDIEESLIKKVLEKVNETLEDAWKNIFAIDCEIIDMDNNYAFIQIATPGEIVALITLEVQVASKYYGLLSICFPYPVLESVLDKLSAQHIFQGQNLSATDEDKGNIVNRLNLTEVTLNVIFGTAEVTTKDFLALQEGDVLKLDNALNSDSVLFINGERKFLGKPGISNNKMSVKITDEYNEYSEFETKI